MPAMTKTALQKGELGSVADIPTTVDPGEGLDFPREKGGVKLANLVHAECG